MIILIFLPKVCRRLARGPEPARPAHPAPRGRASPPQRRTHPRPSGSAKTTPLVITRPQLWLWRPREGDNQGRTLKPPDRAGLDGGRGFFVERALKTAQHQRGNTRDAQRVRARPRSRSPRRARSGHTRTLYLHTDSCFLSKLCTSPCRLPYLTSGRQQSPRLVWNSKASRSISSYQGSSSARTRNML